MKWHSRIFVTVAVGLAVATVNLHAGETPVADLWVSVNVTPSAFQPLSIGVIELTLHNNGPDAAGVGAPVGLGNQISQQGFLLTHPSLPPPYLALPGVTGCTVVYEIFGPNVNMLWGFVWSFYYPVIPAGEARTCRIPIQFTSQPFESFDTRWRILSTPQDPDLTNNTVSYRFISGIPLIPPEPVPGLRSMGQLLLAVSLLLLALRAGVAGRIQRSRTIPGSVSLTVPAARAKNKA